MSNARQQAEKDIREYLRERKGHFIPFVTSLNPVMREIIKQYVKQQKNLNSN